MLCVDMDFVGYMCMGCVYLVCMDYVLYTHVCVWAVSCVGLCIYGMCELYVYCVCVVCMG